MHFTVRAPASAANLGPGFDALGMAFDLWNTIEISTDTDVDTLELAGSESPLLNDRDNYTLLAMRELAQQYGRKLPPLRMTMTAEIPVARGLGSSAAALVCGLVGVDRLLGLDLSLDELFQTASQLEGHGDNVGAAIYGGAVLAVPGISRAMRLSDGVSLGLIAVLFIPEATSATWAARAALPATVPLPDAAFNLSVAAGLAVGLLTGDRAAIAAGMHDRLHQPYRARLFSHLTPMTDAAVDAGAIGACLSGAGPTILALVEPEEVATVADALEATADEYRVKGRSALLKLSSRGVQLCDSTDPVLSD